MKKYNNFSLKWFALWAVGLALAFLVGMNGVYAYFTATAQTATGSITTAIVKINSGELTAGVYQSDPLSVTAGKLVPGDSVGVSTTIQNTGNAEIYVIVKLVETLTLSTSESSTTTTWYNLSGAVIDTALATATVEATYMNYEDGDNSKTFTMGYELDGETYGNAYKNATIEFTLYVYAIQYRNIASATAATQLLLDNFNK